MTREQAIQILVDSECARWGEDERVNAIKANANRSVALAINEIANRIELEKWAEYMPAGLDPKALRAEAKKLMTSDDRRVLRRGG